VSKKIEQETININRTYCWLGDGKGILLVKKWVLVSLVVTISLELYRLQQVWRR